MTETFMDTHRHTRNFIDGALALASLQSTWIGRDDAQAFLFSNENTLEEFRKFFHLNMTLEESEEKETFEDNLKEMFGKDGEDRKLSENLLWLFRYNFKEEKRTYRLKDERAILDYLDDKKRGPYFFHTDFFFVEFEEFTVCIMMGNFE